jgi:thiol-disulfide isomerase/thioredoxin
LLLVAGCVLVALATGCGSKMTRDEAGKSAPNSSPSTAEIDVSLTSVDRVAFDGAVAKQRGKVVLVDFWATWCGPCVEQLPHTLDLARELKDRGLAVITVSCDEPTEVDRVADFLRSKDAGKAINLISQFGGSTQTMEAFDISSGAVPYYQLYDRAGKLRQTFGISPTAKTQFTPADIDAAVKKLLAE